MRYDGMTVAEQLGDVTRFKLEDRYLDATLSVQDGQPPVWVDADYLEPLEDDLAVACTLAYARYLEAAIAALAPEPYVASCPACGDPIDYCQGHGPIGDPVGAAILEAHDNDDHSTCHPVCWTNR